MDIIMRNYISGADYGEVYRLFTDINVNQLIINKPDHNNMGTFSKWLDDKLSHDFNDFMVFRTLEDNFIGFAYSYDFQPLNGHCLFTVAVKPEYQKKGFGGFISIEFLKYLFVNYSLRKIYIHIYGNNEQSLKCAEGFGFQLEGVLQNYRFYNGKYENVKIYSISRDGFYGFIEKMK